MSRFGEKETDANNKASRFAVALKTTRMDKWSEFFFRLLKITGGYKLRKPNIRRKMTILNSLTISKNVEGGPLTSNLLQNIKKN